MGGPIAAIFGLQDLRDLNRLSGISPWANNALAGLKKDVEAYRGNKVDEARQNMECQG